MPGGIFIGRDPQNLGRRKTQPATPGVMDVLPLGTPRQLLALSYTTSHFLHQIDAFTITKRIRDLPQDS